MKQQEKRTTQESQKQLKNGAGEDGFTAEGKGGNRKKRGAEKASHRGEGARPLPP